MVLLIAVDIDGVLTVETDGYDYAERTPNTENIEKLNRLYDSGKYGVVLFTARFKEDEKVTRKWLYENNVKFHRIIFDKLPYNIIVDDKAQKFIPELEKRKK